MDVYIGSDYRGFERKNQLLKSLTATDYNIIDVGAYSYHEGNDFNDPAIAVARNVRKDRDSKGIVTLLMALQCKQIGLKAYELRIAKTKNPPYLLANMTMRMSYAYPLISSTKKL